MFYWDDSRDEWQWCAPWLQVQCRYDRKCETAATGGSRRPGKVVEQACDKTPRSTLGTWCPPAGYSSSELKTKFLTRIHGWDRRRGSLINPIFRRRVENTCFLLLDTIQVIFIIRIYALSAGWKGKWFRFIFFMQPLFWSHFSTKQIQFSWASLVWFMKKNLEWVFYVKTIIFL